MPLLTCKLCKQERKLVKSHIIPFSMYKKMYEQGAVKVYGDSLDYPKRSPNGEYDDSILCEACESSFTKWDNYANKLFQREIVKESFMIDSHGNQRAYIVKGIDYKLLKLFFISLLWRMGVTKREMFKKVSLGRFLGNLEGHILNCNAGENHEFEVVIMKYSDEIGENILISPSKVRFEGLNYIVINLIGYTVYIKVDRRKSKGVLSSFSLKQGEPLIVTLRSFIQGKEFINFGRILEKYP